MKNKTNHEKKIELLVMFMIKFVAVYAILLFFQTRPHVLHLQLLRILLFLKWFIF